MPYFDKADESFLTERTEKVTGWLLDYAARISTAFLNFQDEAKMPGSLMEIGVYGGKYFSLLYRSAERRGSNLVGIDPFEHFTPEQVSQNIGAPVPHANIHFLKGLSADFRVADLMPALGEKASL